MTASPSAPLTSSTSGAWRFAAYAQALIYVGSGLWPVVHLRSFEAITGRKREGWLVKTTGLLIASIGLGLAVAARRRDRATAAVLGASSAASLAAIDVVYGGVKRRISPVYLIDAALQTGLVGAWGATVAGAR